jgi:TonB-linked SusC/RagA family outer membrane protein
MRKLFTLLAALVLLLGQVVAQGNRTIKGKVTDEKGAALSGVTVSAVGTNRKVVTDNSGTFSIEITSKVKALQFSYVGFALQEVSVSDASTVDVTISLKAEDASLSEVVVVGYGTQQKRNVTSAIGKVKGADIANLPTTSFDRQLAGRTAGVQVTQVSGNVSAPPTIRVRGNNSITQGRDPLFVVDGIPSFSGGGSGLVTTNVLADINPADIESIEVLKDGAATAIYGSRAANGVVMITTKKGKSGKMTVNYDMYVGYSKAFNTPELLNAQQFVTISNEKLTNAGLAQGAFMNSENTNTNWFDYIFTDKPIVQSHTLSLSSGTDKSSFYLSVNYLTQQGMILTNKNTRYNIRANAEFKPYSWLKAGNNITLSRTDDFGQNDGGNSLSGAMGGAMRALPNVRVYNPAHITGYNITANNVALGSDANTRTIENNYTNPRYNLDKNIYQNNRYRIINNMFIEVTPIKNLAIRSQASIDFINSQDFQSLDKIHGDGRGSQGSLYNQNYQFSLYTWQNYATYNATIKDHNFTLVGGVEMQRNISQNFYGQGTTVADPFFQTTNLIGGSFVNQFAGGGLTKTGFQSYFSRLNYDFKGKYFASISFRRDGSSRLAPAVRYGNFFGGSAGWRISDEKFYKDLGLTRVINDMKIRASYAEVGNELSASFPWLSTYANAQYGGASGIAANRIGNDKLRWETNKKINIGADFSLLKNRINFSFDYFINQNDDQVYDEPQPVSLGIPGNIITKNIGTMENKGIELQLTADVMKKKDFTWTVNANFTSISNKVKSLAPGLTEQILSGPNNGVFNILRVGQSLNAYYGYNYAGVNPVNGNAMWYKEDGTLIQYNNVAGAAANYYVVDKSASTLGAVTTLGNRYIIGNPLPKWFGGLTNSFMYKGFSLEVFLRYQGGNKIYNLSRQEVWNSMGFVNNGVEVMNRWTTPGQVTDVPKLYYGRDNQVNLQGQANSRFLESGDFLRLQNVTLSYAFAGSQLQRSTKGVIKSARIYVQGNNLHVWTKYNGIDPENFTQLGIDNSSVPQQRSYTLGVNLGF